MMFRNRGFTLIETMAVVAIMGILCVAAAPTLIGALRHRALDQVARNIGSAIYQARSQALLNRQTYSVDVGGNYFQVRALRTNQVLSRYPADPAAYLDPSIWAQASDWVTFNYTGCLVDGNGSPNANVVINVTDNATQENLKMLINYTGGIVISRTN